MKILLTSDWHLDSNPRNEYRWDLFAQLKRLVKTEKIDKVVGAGDTTDSADNHPAQLVNRLVNAIADLASTVPLGMDFIRGNHDGVDFAHPYFEFLNLIPKVTYYKEPHIQHQGKEPTLVYLPHSRNPQEDWRSLKFKKSIVFAHVCVNNAIAENMQKLESSIESSYFKDALLTFSGDIHKPQEVPPVIYIGSPYNVRFGDNFDGGGIILDTESLKWERFKHAFPYKLVFRGDNLLTFQNQMKDAIKAGYGNALIKIQMFVNQTNVEHWRQLEADIRKFIDEETDFVLQVFDRPNQLQPKLDKTHEHQKHFMSFDKYCADHSIKKDLVAYGQSIINETRQGNTT